jgi:tetratricopeptide (TPR) repeat protein
LEKSTALQKHVRIAYLDLGAVLTQQKEYAKAITALKRAEQLDPAQPDAPYRLGRVYRALGRAVEAEAEFEKVKKLHQELDAAVSVMMPEP